MLAKFSSLVVIAVASLIAPAVARAEGPTERKALQQVADCVVARHQTEALDLFLNKFNNPTEYRRQNKILLDEIPDCLKKTGGPFAGGIKMSLVDFDEMVADSLIRTLYILHDPGDLAAVPYFQRPAIEALEIATVVQSNRARQTAFRLHIGKLATRLRDLLAECVVRSNSAGSRRLLITQADSSEEEAAFSALRSDLNSCIPQPLGLQLPGRSVRDSMAVVYLSLANGRSPP